MLACELQEVQEVDNKLDAGMWDPGSKKLTKLDAGMWAPGSRKLTHLDAGMRDPGSMNALKQEVDRDAGI